MKYAVVATVLLCAAPACAARPSAVPILHLIGIGTLPSGLMIDDTQVGGLSGIDYDRVRDRWVIISDDKSEYGPARFYVAQIPYGATRAPAPRLTRMIPLRDETGATFEPRGQGKEASDGESIRLVPGTRDMVWSTEGDGPDGFGPSIRRMDAAGQIPLGRETAADLLFRSRRKDGAAPNLSLEGLTFPDRSSLWVSMEAPFVQDGALASAAQGASVRFTHLDWTTGAARQFVYETDAIAPHDPARLADNGVSEILSFDARHLLVLERSGIQQADGDFHFHIRLYLADLDGADDVAALPTLQGASYRPLRKTLLLNFDTLPGVTIDNVEGMSWGRTLRGGGRSLLFVTDNNFSPRHDTQFIAFSVR